VALQARNLDVGTGKAESGLVVVKGSLFPPSWRMALRAKRPILAPVGIGLLVTGKAVYRCSSEASRWMTVDTTHRLVLPHQPKGGQIMINGRFFPTIRRVALVANYSQTALMGIILTVTAGAVDRCPPEDSIHVAVLAIDHLMLTHQGKSG
jgi:hypothetical protein